MAAEQRGCTFYAAGKCHRGRQCSYSHDPKALVRVLGGVLVLLPHDVAPAVVEMCNGLLEGRHEAAAAGRTAMATWCAETKEGATAYANPDGERRWPDYQRYKKRGGAAHAPSLARAEWFRVFASRVGHIRVPHLHARKAFAAHAEATATFAEHAAAMEGPITAHSLATFAGLDPPKSMFGGHPKGERTAVNSLLVGALDQVGAEYDDQYAALFGAEALTLGSWLSGHPRADYGGYPFSFTLPFGGVDLPLGPRQGAVSYARAALEELEEEACVRLLPDQLDKWRIRCANPTNPYMPHMDKPKPARIYVVCVPTGHLPTIVDGAVEFHVADKQ
jgi:hypothetical protein